MISFANYENKKVRLRNMFSMLLSIFSDFSLTNQINSVRDDILQLENEKFHLVVVGEFSRGKSTFINAMLGKKILPASKKPTTAVISTIVYDEEPGYVIHYKNGKIKTVSEVEFENIKAQSEEKSDVLERMTAAMGFFKKKNLSDIAYAEIRYPLLFCKNHVEVVDTPGTNDLNVGRVEITHNYLRKADAAILVLWAAQPLTRSELDFLHHQLLGNQINDVFVIINGKDNCKDGDESRVVEYVMNQLSEEVKNGLRVFPVSGKQALTWRRKENGETLKSSVMKWLPKSIEETGLPTFEKALLRFLDEEKGRIKLEKYAICIQRYFEVIENQIQSQYDAANNSTYELRRQLVELRKNVHRAKAEATRIMKYMEESLMRKETDIENEAKSAYGDMKQAALEAVYGCTVDTPKEEIKHQIDVAIMPVQEQFLENTTKLQEYWIWEAWDRALDELQGIWADMNLAHSENLPSLLKEDCFNQLKKENINDGSFSLPMKCVGGLLLGIATVASGGGALVAAYHAYLFYKDWKQNNRMNKVEESIRNQYDQQYQAFIDNAKEQYRSVVSQVCTQLDEEVEGRLDGMEQQLASIVQLREASEGDANKIKSTLLERYNAVQRMKVELAEVMS